MKRINRREFLGGVGIGATGTLGSKLINPYRANFNNTKTLKLNEEENINPCDIKLNVKLVVGACIHSGMWEGPCRVDARQTSEEERIQLRNQYKRTVESSKNRLSQDVNLLEPVYYEYTEDIDASIGEDLYQKLEKDKDEVDLYLINANVFGQYFFGIIGRRFRKPAAMIGSLINMEGAAYLRSIGVEGYAPENYDELNNLITILRARKAFQQTNILFSTDRGRRLKRNVSCISDFEDLKKRFGINTKIITYKELSDEMDRVKQSRDTVEKAENIANKLIKNARKCNIDRKYVVNDVGFYFAIKNLMRRYNNNAFAVECRELCASRLPYKWKANPCLTHSLLKSEGYSSACEGDINALLSMRFLMSLSKKAAYMGNLYYRGENVVRLGHEVSALKMNGFDTPDLPYELRNFIVSGWGTKLQIELDKLIEKKVTFARIDPLAKKILVAKGEVIGCEGFGKVGCVLRAIINVPNARELTNKRADYGFHYAMVYGDYTREVIKLADMLNVEVETHNSY